MTLSCRAQMTHRRDRQQADRGPKRRQIPAARSRRLWPTSALSVALGRTACTCLASRTTGSYSGSRTAVVQQCPRLLEHPCLSLSLSPIGRAPTVGDPYNQVFGGARGTEIRDLVHSVTVTVLEPARRRDAVRRAADGGRDVALEAPEKTSFRDRRHQNQSCPVCCLRRALSGAGRGLLPVFSLHPFRDRAQLLGDADQSAGSAPVRPIVSRAIACCQITKAERTYSVPERLGGAIVSATDPSAEAVFVAVVPSAEVTRSRWKVLTRPTEPVCLGRGRVRRRCSQRARGCS